MYRYIIIYNVTINFFVGNKQILIISCYVNFWIKPKTSDLKLFQLFLVHQLSYLRSTSQLEIGCNIICTTKIKEHDKHVQIYG